MTKKRNWIVKTWIVTLVLGIMTMTGAVSAEAAAKPSLSVEKTTVQAGKKTTITIKNLKKSNVSALTLTSSKKAVATVQKKTMTSFVVKGVKKGTATITAKVKLKKAVAKKKTYTLQLKVTVKKTETTASNDPHIIYPDNTPAKFKKLTFQKEESASKDRFYYTITNHSSEDLRIYGGMEFYKKGKVQKNVGVTGWVIVKKGKDINVCNVEGIEYTSYQLKISSIEKNTQKDMYWDASYQGASNFKITKRITNTSLYFGDEVSDSSNNVEISVKNVGKTFAERINLRVIKKKNGKITGIDIFQGGNIPVGATRKTSYSPNWNEEMDDAEVYFRSALLNAGPKNHSDKLQYESSVENGMKKIELKDENIHDNSLYMTLHNGCGEKVSCNFKIYRYKNNVLKNITSDSSVMNKNADYVVCAWGGENGVDSDGFPIEYDSYSMVITSVTKEEENKNEAEIKGTAQVINQENWGDDDYHYETSVTLENTSNYDVKNLRYEVIYKNQGKIIYCDYSPHSITSLGAKDNMQETLSMGTFEQINFDEVLVNIVSFEVIAGDNDLQGDEIVQYTTKTQDFLRHFKIVDEKKSQNVAYKENETSDTVMKDYLFLTLEHSNEFTTRVYSTSKIYFYYGDELVRSRELSTGIPVSSWTDGSGDIDAGNKLMIGVDITGIEYTSYKILIDADIVHSQHYQTKVDVIIGKKVVDEYGKISFPLTFTNTGSEEIPIVGYQAVLKQGGNIIGIQTGWVPSDTISAKGSETATLWVPSALSDVDEIEVNVIAIIDSQKG